jgi:hypothetical protein
MRPEPAILASVDDLVTRLNAPSAEAQSALVSPPEDRTVATANPMAADAMSDASLAGVRSVEPNAIGSHATVLALLPQQRLTQSGGEKRVTRVLQKWEGIVLEIRDDAFVAKLLDRTGSHADEIAEIELDEVSPDDLSLLERGAVFYWSIGYSTERNGQRQRTSAIRFRRLPAWSAEELETARLRAEALARDIGWG